MQSTRTRKRQRLTTGEREAMQAEALDRAEHGRTCGNDLLIITAFAARGIDASPRVDCFTFNAWKALHRHVRKGEHGVHVPVYVTVADQDKDNPDKIHVHKVPTGAVVFHVSQTDPDADKPTIDPPFTAQERDTLDNIEATQRQDSDADDREQAEDDHERALLEQEQRDEAAGPAIVIVDPLTGATLRRVLIADVATKDDRPEIRTPAEGNTPDQATLF